MLLTYVIEPIFWIPQLLTEKLDVLLRGSDERDALEVPHRLPSARPVQALKEENFALQDLRLGKYHAHDASLNNKNNVNCES